MKFRLERKERRSPASIAISLAIHGALIVLLATLTWHYPILGIRGDQKLDPTVTRISFIRIPPRAREGEGGTDETAALRGRVPQQMPAPTAIPSTIPAPTTGATPPGIVAGVPGGTGVAPRGDVIGPTTGITLSIPDPRLNLNPAIVPVPRNLAYMNDSAVKAFYQEYRDSLAAALANPKRAPGDWSFDRNGQKYGWDADGIHIGKYNIPNAILAAIKVPVSGGGNINAMTNGRIAAWTQRDLMEHSQAMSVDELKAAAKRIRERVDRERAEAQKAAQPPKKGGGG